MAFNDRQCSDRAVFAELFVEHEIDLELFKTLTESELRDLGIHAFGVRRRMLLTIAGKHVTSQFTQILLEIHVFKLSAFLLRTQQEDGVLWKCCSGSGTARRRAI